MKRFVRVALVLAMSWAATGCGSTVEHDEAVRYTPESLAQELAFRYRDLSPAAKKATKNRSEPKGKASAAAEREAQTKAQTKSAVTKKAEAETADDLLDEIAGKARMIRTTPPAEVFRKMSEAIARDQSLDENDRQALAGKLDEMAQAER